MSDGEAVQEAEPMFDTRNDLPANTRSRVTELLNARLADSMDLGAAKIRVEAHLHGKR
jgi:hypothetical protein